MLYNEVSAATLIKVDINGNILDQGVTLLISVIRVIILISIAILCTVF